MRSFGRSHSATTIASRTIPQSFAVSRTSRISISPERPRTHISVPNPIVPCGTPPFGSCAPSSVPGASYTPGRSFRRRTRRRRGGTGSPGRNCTDWFRAYGAREPLLLHRGGRSLLHHLQIEVPPWLRIVQLGADVRLLDLELLHVRVQLVEPREHAIPEQGRETYQDRQHDSEEPRRCC